MKKIYAFLFALTVALSAVTAFTQQAAAVTKAQDGGLIEHGRYIATIAGCTACHTSYRAEFQNLQSLTPEQMQIIAFRENEAWDEEKSLAGGRAFDLGPAGTLLTRNITPDKETGIGSWTDDQIKIAIKTGVTSNGKTLFPVMPYHVYNGMADSDLEAVVAFIRSVKAVNNPVPENTVPTEGLPVPPFTTGITAPDSADLAARGEYLVKHVTGCTDCHTPVDPNTGAPIMDKYLAGRQPYEGPWGIVYGGNITPDAETGIGDWTEEEIKRAIVSGIGRGGRRLILMPWYSYSALTSEDAEAIAYYLKSALPAVKNEIPAASLNPGFEVMAEDAQQTEGASGSPFTSPYALGALALIVIAAAAYLFLKRKPAN